MKKIKESILKFINRVLNKHNLKIMRVYKGGEEIVDIESKKSFLDINGKVKYVKKKKYPFEDIEKMKEAEKWSQYFLTNQKYSSIAKILYSFNDSTSQKKQDLFVLSVLNFKQNGFFVEFGAANGKHLSNTYLLEKEFNWKGILAEPAHSYHDSILKNRDCFFEKDCVWNKSNEQIKFLEHGLLSTIEEFQDSDQHIRNSDTFYSVNTISLNDLLKKYNAPKEIDYLSIDTEGSEYDILNAFDFDSYKFKVITVEHNYTIQRENLFNLLTKNGYKRIFTEVSEYDDWYVFDKL